MWCFRTVLYISANIPLGFYMKSTWDLRGNVNSRKNLRGVFPGTLLLVLPNHIYHDSTAYTLYNVHNTFK